MKLAERLHQMPKEEYIYLGCSDGSGWMYIGKISALEKNLGKLNNYLVTSMAKTLSNYATRIAQVEAKRAVGDAEIMAKQSSIQALKSRRNALVDTLKDWKLIKDCEVIDEHQTTNTEPFGMAILIEGTIRGEFWTYEDVKALKKERQRKGNEQEAKKKGANIRMEKSP